MDECKALTNKILAWINGSSLTINHYYLILPNKYDDIIVCFLKPFLEQGHENSNRQQILKNKQAFKLGSSIAKLITSSWNSQEKLEKVYIFNRKVHHSGVGALLGLRSLFSKSQPIPSEILSGLGKL
jgi:hypothetical protein